MEAKTSHDGKIVLKVVCVGLGDREPTRASYCSVMSATARPGSLSR